ncbi:MAG: biotin attachment protein [Thalassobius sp.]|nr:biotin attachment protein [Thalassovita sp.]
MLRLSPNSKIDETHYKQKLNSLKSLQTPKSVKGLSRWLAGVCILAFITMFLPWQQNIRADGELTALSPSDRPQTVETAIAGRIIEWKIREGQQVEAGDTLVRIAEIKEKYFDPDLLLRLQEQVNAKEQSIASKIKKAEALQMQANALRSGLKLKLEQTENKIVQKRLKVESDSNDVLAAKTNVAVAERQVNMYQNLYDSGLVALTKLESAKIKVQEARAKVVSAQNKLNSSRNDLEIEKLNLSTVEAEYLDKIAKSESDRSATLADIYDGEGMLAKSKNELANMIIRNQQYAIVAPQSGYIVKALKNGIGETVKEQEPLLTIMPSEPDKAVALYINAMDVPLLSVGRHVRLQFDGWPAIQFSGWPSVSVGTFGGKVSVIDQVGDQTGKYRVLISPDKREGDEEWPEELRLGSGVYGWVMLDDVPVYFELWRNLNGFPPTVSAYSKASSGSDTSKSKDKKK